MEKGFHYEIQSNMNESSADANATPQSTAATASNWSSSTIFSIAQMIKSKITNGKFHLNSFGFPYHSQLHAWSVGLGIETGHHAKTFASHEHWSQLNGMSQTKFTLMQIMTNDYEKHHWGALALFMHHVLQSLVGAKSSQLKCRM